MEATLAKEIYALMVALAVVWTPVGCSRCSFPVDWRGRWLMGGDHELNIREHSISDKGVCREANTDKGFFMLEDRDKGCHLCLLMMKRHHNIIQYKEGYCVEDKKTLIEVCKLLRIEIPLLTLVRDPSLPQQCPFQNAFHFSYNNNSGGFCNEPKSYVKPCASESKFSFHFKRCGNVFDSYDRDLKFECLATWKDGSDMYMYGGFSGPGINHRQDMYRCFLYEALGSDFHMAMSADTSCRGLRSPRDGPMVIQFKKDSVGWVQPKCSFEGWMNQETWQDLSGRHLYKLDKKGEVLRVDYRRRPQARPHTQAAYRCLNIQQENSTDNQLVAMSLASHQCVSSRQCIKILRRHQDVLEIHQGKIKGDMDTECSPGDFINATRHIILPQKTSGEPCPLAGKYMLEHAIEQCKTHVHIGCNSTAVMEVQSTCPAFKAKKLECLRSWEEIGRKFVIARSLDTAETSSFVSNCFVFEDSHNSIHFYTDKHCNDGVPDVFEDAIRYTFKTPAAGCDETSYEIFKDAAVNSNSNNGNEVKAVTRENNGGRSNIYGSILIIDLLMVTSLAVLSHLSSQMMTSSR